MRYLLDTNIVSFLIRQKPAALIHRVRQNSDKIFLSTIIEAELRLGLALVPPEAKVRPATENFLLNVEIESWDSRCAAKYATLGATQRRLGKPLALLDSMIAAHALAEDCILVTNDQAFLHVEDLRVEDWTRGPQAT